MPEQSQNKPDKGGVAEEALRNYFRSLGAFVLRGVPIREGRDDITDIDLWTYTRASVHARHISIVDIKNKKRAKGYERVIWLKGLQSALAADEAVVASTSSRENLKPFADRLGVRMLSHGVLDAILKRFEQDPTRLSAEEVYAQWGTTRVNSPATLYSRMQSNLEEVGRGLTFSSLNVWIDETADLLTYSLDHEKIGGPVLRACYLCAALIALGGDYLGRGLSFSDQETRRTFFRNGLIFGRTDKDIVDGYLRFAEGLATDYIDKSGAAAATMRMGFKNAADTMPINQFVEFFSRPTAGRELVDAALQLEQAAFSSHMQEPAMLFPEAKTLLMLVADYRGIKRRSVLKGQSHASSAKPTDEPTADLFASK